MSTTTCKDCGNTVSTDAAACPKCGAPIKKKTSWLTLTVGAVFAFLFLSVIMVDRPETPTSTTPAKPDPVRQLKFDYKWNLGGFGNVMLLHRVRIQNPTDINLKDPLIRCSLYAASGTSVGNTQTVIYQPLRAKGRISVNEINMGIVNNQAKTASCRIVMATPM